jgi:outer membrane protein assembly factor BamB
MRSGRVAALSLLALPALGFAATTPTITSFAPTSGPLGTVFYSTSDGGFHKLFGWDIAPSGPQGCFPAPVVANSVMYAGNCASVGAYQAANGALIWSVASGQVTGLTVADGVLYTCENGQLFAYNAANGQRLWTGGDCFMGPVVANGIVAGAITADITTYSLANQGLAFVAPEMPRPDPSDLKPNWTLVAQPTPEQ